MALLLNCVLLAISVENPTAIQRYKGVARVTSRRARKGFTLRYNPDAHWSTAFYRSLNLQFSDGKDTTNINRDDAAGFRLDTYSPTNNTLLWLLKAKKYLELRM